MGDLHGRKVLQIVEKRPKIVHFLVKNQYFDDNEGWLLAGNRLFHLLL